MKKATLKFLAVVTCAALAACSDQLKEAPLGPDALSTAGRPAPPDISGEWRWSETQQFLVSVELATLIGITPEGRHTQVTCQNSGAMDLDQDGSSFVGVAGQDGDCVTRGGQEFEFDIPFPFIEIVDGRISGRTIHFGFSSPLCPYMGVLQFEDGEVVGVRGTGGCRPFSLDGSPPPDQFAIHARWEATRVD